MGSLSQTLTAGFAAAEGPSYLGLFVYLGLVLALLFGLMAVAKQHFKERIFKHWTAQVFEQLYLFIENLCVGIIGGHGRKYVPMLMTIWMIIFVGNLVALFMPTSNTADLSFNLAMALIAVLYVQYEGMKGHADHLVHKGQNPVVAWVTGFFKHMFHFTGPKLPIYLVAISVMIFVVEIISELMKNVSLSLRLFGNIHGGHQAVEAMNQLGAHIGGMPWLNIPFGFFLIPIKLLTCVVQALIFCLLTAVYISLVSHHDDHEEHEAEHPEGGTPAMAH